MTEQKFSRYEIREELGLGGMATVYRAYDPLFEREVAVKVLKRELLEDSQLRERFERETKIIARLEHAAIVPVYDVGHDNKQLFYVMRYMTGGTLSERIQDGMTLGEIAYVVLRVASGLDYAHNKGIVHRDLKPGNILFDDNNNPYISDFGIAKIAEAATRITSSGIIGTPRYMSPEQARGEAADGRSDLYSLGIIVFEMLSGKSPFEATTPLAMAYKHATEAPPSILRINPSLPEGIGPILEKALAKNPDDRYRNCAEFANAFFEIFPDAASSEANFVTPPPPRARVVAETPTVLPPNLVPELSQPKPGSRSWMFWGSIALILIMLGGWGFSQLNGINSASTLTPQPATPTSASPSPTLAPALTAIPTEAVPTEVPASIWPGGADKIAVTSNNDIYVMDIDGGNARQLTNTNLPKFDLQWVSDGNKLLYGEGRCVYQIDASTSGPKPEKLVCFDDKDFDGFRVSPDGKYVAISIAGRLIVYPFDLPSLAGVKSVFELQNSEGICLDYADVTVKGTLWSADGKSLAILYKGTVGQRIGDTIRVMQINVSPCTDLDPLIMDEIPGRHFVPEGYEAFPILPNYDWDGAQRFLFNTLKRNNFYGELYLYDMSNDSGVKLNPVNGICCYSNATFSPDGKYILLVFQDVRRGADAVTQLYYIPIDQIGNGSTFSPLKLFVNFFPKPRENIEIALHQAPP